MKKNETRKNESPDFAKALYYTFMSFFGGIPGFAEKRDNGRITFVREFPEKKLQIVVTAPLFVDAQENMYSLNGLYIQFEVRFDGKSCLELVDSRIFPSYLREWQLVAKRKIEALVALIEDIPRCPRCTEKIIYPYPVQRAEAQVAPDPTTFVQYRCPECKNMLNSTFGKRIKENLHRFLIKKKA
jgi:hypothetical protein